jgi:hypothetical protein
VGNVWGGQWGNAGNKIFKIFLKIRKNFKRDKTFKRAKADYLLGIFLKTKILRLTFFHKCPQIARKSSSLVKYCSELCQSRWWSRRGSKKSLWGLKLSHLRRGSEKDSFCVGLKFFVGFLSFFVGTKFYVT